MVKTLRLSITILLMSTTWLCQAQKTFVLKRSETQMKMGKYRNAFSVSQLRLDNIQVPKYDTTQVESDSYKTLLVSIEKLETDSIRYASEFHSQLENYKKYKSVADNLQAFLESNEKFKDKKEYLRKAQIAAEDVGLEINVYADKSVNTDFQSDFLLYKFDKNGLNDLVKSSLRYPQQFAREPKPSYNQTTVNRDLADKREGLSRTNRYETKTSQSGVKTIPSLVEGQTVNDLAALEGVFNPVRGKNYVITTAHSEYVSGQIVGDSIRYTPDFKVNRAREIFLYQHRETGEYYWDNGGMLFFANCGTDDQVNQFVQKLTQSGYKVVDAKDGKEIIVGDTHLSIQPDLFEEVNNGNINYVNEVASAVDKFKQYMKQAQPLTSKIAMHFTAHLAFTMTTDRLTTWKRDVQKAIELENKIKSLTGYKGYLRDQIDSQTLSTHTEFVQVLRSSRVVLGM